MDRMDQLARGPRATQRRSHHDLRLPCLDRVHVVPGLPMEAAAADLRWISILDRRDGGERGLRVSPRAGDQRLSALLELHPAGRLSGRAVVCDLAHPRFRGEAVRTVRGGIFAAPVSRTLSPPGRMAV